MGSFGERESECDIICGSASTFGLLLCQSHTPISLCPFRCHNPLLSLPSILSLPEVENFDLQKIYTNDIAALLRTYGVEAAMKAIVLEISGVFAVYGISVNPRHLSLIAASMTKSGG